LLTVMVHLSGCSAVSCHLTVYTKFRTPSYPKDQMIIKPQLGALYCPKSEPTGSPC
jgi:hypothetical protein